jgi:hypothetical protein
MILRELAFLAYIDENKPIAAVEHGLDVVHGDFRDLAAGFVHGFEESGRVLGHGVAPVVGTLGMALRRER